MNRAIGHVYAGARLRARRRARLHGLLAALGRVVARRAARQRPPGRAAALDQARADPGRRRHEARRPTAARRRRTAGTSTSAATRRARCSRTSSATRRRPTGAPASSARPTTTSWARTPTSAGRSQSELHSLAGGSVTGDDVQVSLLPGRAAHGHERARGDRQAGRRVRARAAHRPRARERVVAELRPEQGGAGLAAARSGSALVNRATQGLYPPGSSIKPVIAALALESGKYTPTSTFNDPGYFVEYGRRIYNDSGERFSGAFDLTDALTHSINSVFAQPRQRALQRARALPGAARARCRARLLLDPAARLPDRPARRLGHGAPGHEPARVPERAHRSRPHGDRAGHLVATPMQMAMVAGAFANGGVVMRPTLVDRVRSPERARCATSATASRCRAVSARRSRRARPR